MFELLSSLIPGTGSKKSLAQKYTEDLSEITLQINALDKALKSNESALRNLQSSLTYYGISLSILVVSICTVFHVPSTTSVLLCIIASGVPCIVLLILVKLLTNTVYSRYNQRQYKKLGKLRAAHQKKLNKLKEETHYNETNSIIQRFSSGDDQSQDALLLLDEELSEKYKELNNLKLELEELKKQSLRGRDSSGINNSDRDENDGEDGAREAWFDKVIGLLAGGNEITHLPRLIVCPRCHRHAGCYRMIGQPINYSCPFCSFTINELEKPKPTLGTNDERMSLKSVDAAPTKNGNEVASTA